MREEYDVLVIGAGPGGYVAAIRSGQLQMRTILVEKESVNGGTCLNYGCIPSKTLLHFSEMYRELKLHGAKRGIVSQELAIEIKALMRFKSDTILGLNKGVSGLLAKNKVKRLQGEATFIDPHTVELKQATDKIEIQAKHIILATGSEPIALPFLPFDDKNILSSTSILSLSKIPKSLVVIGAGVIGLELGSVFSRFGSEVTFIEFLDHVAGSLDSKLSKTLQASLKKQGMHFELSTKVASASVNDSSVAIKAEGKNPIEINAEKCLVAIGRRPYTKNLGLDKAQVSVDERGFVIIDKNFHTSQSHIYAIGDIVEGPMLAHKASTEGEAVAEIIHGEKPVINYFAIPSVIYTNPEVASVGLTIDEAKKRNIAVKEGSFSFMGNSRAHCVDAKEGYVSLVIDAKTHNILGLHMMGPYVSELIALGIMAIEKRITADELSSYCFPHPTFSEAIKEAAMAALGKVIHN